MSPFAELALFLPILAVLTWIFGRNAQDGLRTGSISLKAMRYDRDTEPAAFWMSIGFSIFFTLACLAAIVVCGGALLFPG